MKIKLLLLVICFVSLNSFNLYSNEKDSLSLKKNTHPTSEQKTAQFVQFPELDKKFPIENLVNKITLPEFTFANLKNEFRAPVTSVNDSRSEAEKGFNEIDSTGRWISSFRNEDIQVLPVGIKHKLNEVEYQLGFTKARFTKEYTELTVFVKIILPQSDEEGLPIELFFGANNVKLSHQGGIIGEANLVLLGDIFIPFNGGNWLLILKGGFDYKTGDTQNRTYVTIDCDGVKEMGIEGEVQFSRNMILPVDVAGKPLPETVSYQGALREPIQIPNRVRGAFKAVASDWNDMIVEISLSPFVMASQPDKFMFSVNQAVFDFSDLRTENVNFPQHYYDEGLLLPNPDTWRGVYVQSLKVGLPQEFKTEESISQKNRITFEAANLLIDSYGVSGYFSAENIIPIKSGRTSESKSWAYSVDKIGIELASNRLIGADFNGRILLPISDKGDKNGTTAEGEDGRMGLGYAGIISENEYGLVVSTLDTLSFDVFKAKAELLPNSSVELMVIDGNFRPKAVLNGRMAISASQKESLANEGSTYTTGEGDKKEKHTVQFKGIEFQNLVLQTTSPVIQVDYFGYKDEVKLANFPVSIANIAFMSNEYEAGIEFDLMLNLMGKESKGFAADARLGIFGKFEEENYKQRWKYDRLDLSRINIEANMGAIQLKGGLELMNNDPVYGDGFSAEIEGTFGSFGPITCKAIFGKNEFRYWYVDAAVRGLKIQVGPLQISGFAGGAFYKMTRRPNAGPDFSPSGLSYVPSENSSLGVKAMVFAAIGDESAIAVGAGFEIEFNNNGGVNRLGLFGEAQLMKAFDFPNPVGKLTDRLSGMVDSELINGVMDSKAGKTFLDKADLEYEPEIVGEAAISAKMGMEFDFVNDSFHATFDLYVNVAGGIVQGRASGGRAGWGVVHISKEEWYVHMGTPTDRLGLKMGVGSFSIETGGYFMMGDRIPGSPPPPAIVAEILGVDAEELNYMRDENALGEGRGFAFGADFSIDTGDLRFLILYARFQAGVGFDIMLKDYGDARCVNTGDEVGINGWYANGQSYAYLQGELGINIKLFFIKKKIPIIKGGAAVLLQGKGPNPFWFRGYAGGYYNLLGGLIKGSFRFKLTIGKECELENTAPMGGIKMITDVTPKEGDGDIDVFAAPQAAFAMKINQPIVIPEDSGDNVYKVILEKFNVTDESGKEIVGTLEWGQMNDRATFISDDILPPATKLKVTVEVSFQEKVNGSFQTILEDGQKAIEVEERNFTTGTAPDHIPLHNIQYSYPVVDQQLFYPDEHNNGYIQLQRGQDYLFDNSQWESVVKYIDENGDVSTADFNYSNSDNKVSYKFPKVKNDFGYNMSIISSTKSSGGSSSNETSSETTDYGDDNTLEVRTNNAENVLKEGEIERLAYEFKSSQYKTFADKIKSIKVNDDNWGKINSVVIYLTSQIKYNEGFDIVELLGNSYSDNKALVEVESDLQDDYFKKDINPILYQKYTQGSRYSISRDASEYGYTPKRALPILSNYITSLENNVDLNWRATRFPFRYNLPDIYFIDYLDVRDRVINDYANGLISSGSQELSIISEEYKFMLYGKYNIKLQYNLPGGIKGTSANYKYKNPILGRQ
ncbi:hypothetical protein [Aquimarina algiphila]|uniref:Cell surface protein SprA n=1 Tax=Aquimarina algiphila TaxID=2047982 RepID=A0A554VET3_9FLAO|nr:hypothetical protein [Aquimarina algiphila]TSE05631.1 hypothetical protein FOF46_22120 [Aquimarina algiphila]